jgi:superfamily II DNA or RNA helicase
LILRSYQRAALSETRAAIVSGKRAPLVVLPTGGGKTCLGAAMAEGHLARSQANRVVWLAHRRELVAQGAETLRRVGLDVGANGLNAGARTQVASVQTVLRRGQAPEGTLVFLDEAHHFMSDEWRAFFDVYAHAIKVGLTATPERGDGRALGERFDHLVVGAQVQDLIAVWHADHTQGLVPVEVIRPRKLLGPDKIAQTPADAYMQYARGRRAVVFAPHIRACQEFAEQFAAAGLRVRVVEGKTADETRDESLALFAAGKVDVLVNCMVLTEGWDCPPADVCILARGCGSVGLMLQMCGRVMRPSEGKRGALVIDLRGITHTLGDPDEERIFSLDGDGIGRKGAAAGLRVCKRCQALMPDVGACTECGREPDELVTPVATGDELAKFASMRALTADKRVAWLAKQVRVMREKSYKKGWLVWRYKAVFGHYPTSEMICEAERMT